MFFVGNVFFVFFLQWPGPFVNKMQSYVSFELLNCAGIVKYVSQSDSLLAQSSVS